MEIKRKTTLNAALDLGTIANWISGSLSFATKKKYKVKNDQKAIYLMVDNNNQIVISPKDQNTGTITKQTQEGKNTMESDPITYKTTGDCLSQITKMLSTNSNRNTGEVDNLLFNVSASLRRAFTKPETVAVNSSRKTIRLNSDNLSTEPKIPNTGDSDIMARFKENLANANINWEEFQMVAFNDPKNPETCVLTFYDSTEKVLVGTTLDNTNPGIVESCPDAFFEHFAPGDGISSDNTEYNNTTHIEEEDSDL